MSESLKQKAKTIRQRLAHGCCENWNSGSPCDKECDEPLIELSVAQQEIDKLKTFRDNAYKKWCDSQAELERECGLQKQKLREFWKWLEQKAWRGVSSEVIDEFGERFEELLK
jgi:hypothetical protein